MKIDVHSNLTCALSAEGEVSCWGQAVVGTPRQFEWGAAAPLRVTGLPRVRDLRSGALAVDGRLYNWGWVCPSYRYGEERDPSYDIEADLLRYPNEVFRYKGTGRNDCRCTRRAILSRIEAPGGFWHDEGPCYVLADRTVTCEGGDELWAPNWREGEAWNMDEIVDLGLSAGAQCMLHRDGTAACLLTGPWIGLPEDHPFARYWIEAPFRRPARELYGVSNGLCALLDTGEVECGKFVGTFERPELNIPVFQPHRDLIPGLENPRDFDADEAMFIDDRGKLFTYGLDYAPSGKEIGWVVKPGPVTDPAMELGSGDRFRCVRTEAGRVQCWGRNSAGECGIGKPTEDDVVTPAYVVAPVDVPTHPVPPLPQPTTAP